MRTFLVIAVAACAMASPATAVETSDFSLGTTRDLVAVCSGDPEEELYAEALQFCYGFVAGIAHMHRMLVETGDTKPIACPRHEITREALVAIVLDWTGANSGAMDLLPAESVGRAAEATWPCAR